MTQCDNEAIKNALHTAEEDGDEDLTNWLKELLVWQQRATVLRDTIGLSNVPWEEVEASATELRQWCDSIRDRISAIAEELRWSFHPHCMAAHGKLLTLLYGKTIVQHTEALEHASKYNSATPHPPGTTGRVRVEKGGNDDP